MFAPQHLVALLTLALFVAPALTKAAAQAPTERLAPPDAAAVAKAQKAVRVILGEEIEKAKTPAARKALSIKMLELANDAKEHADNRWVLYTLAREFAAFAADLPQALRSLDALTNAFAVASRIEFEVEIAENMAKITSPFGPGNAPLLDFIDATMVRAVQSDDFRIAGRLVNLGLTIAQKNPKDSATIRRFQTRARIVNQMAKAFDEAKTDETLMGKYFCFWKGDWANGLPLLVKVKEEGLAAAAKRDLEQTMEAKDLIVVGDAWWDLAEKAKDTERTSMLLRSLYWYRRGVSDTSGLAKVKIESRIKKGTTEVDTNTVLLVRVNDGEAAERRPGEVAEVEVTQGVKIIFCWIPAGEARLGSPPRERLAISGHLGKGMERNRVASEAEELRGKFKTQGFWLGKYAITQAEWEAVMKKNPSFFSKQGGGKGKVAGMDTSRFPVEQVSWNDCQDFLEKANATVKLPVAIGKGKLALPHEDQWEYACRGGLGNQQEFYFGRELNGTQANSKGDEPFGTTTKGPNLGRTTRVGSYEEVAPHPWGLCDMHGNVWQWCSNWYDKGQKERIFRGGSYFGSSRSCRSASRVDNAPDHHSHNIGFRLIVAQD